MRRLIALLRAWWRRHSPSRRLDEALAAALYRGLRHDEAMERQQAGLHPFRPLSRRDP